MCLYLRKGDVKRTRELRKRTRPFPAWKKLTLRSTGLYSYIKQDYTWKQGVNEAEGEPRWEVEGPWLGEKAKARALYGGAIHCFAKRPNQAVYQRQECLPMPMKEGYARTILVRVWIRPQDVISVGHGGKQVAASRVTIRPKTWAAIQAGFRVCR